MLKAKHINHTLRPHDPPQWKRDMLHILDALLGRSENQHTLKNAKQTPPRTNRY
jgi:hypothetical protein